MAISVTLIVAISVALGLGLGLESATEIVAISVALIAACVTMMSAHHLEGFLTKFRLLYLSFVDLTIHLSDCASFTCGSLAVLLSHGTKLLGPDQLTVTGQLQEN